jgi:hypothetical protein
MIWKTKLNVFQMTNGSFFVSNIDLTACSEGPHFTLAVDRHKRPKAAVRHALAMLQCGSSKQTLRLFSIGVAFLDLTL